MVISIIYLNNIIINNLFSKAAIYNRNLIVQMLINAGADIESKTNDGVTALMFGNFIFH